MNKSLRIALAFLSFSFQSAGQLQNDSLQKILNRVHDTTKIRMLFEWSENCASEDIYLYTGPGLKLTDELLTKAKSNTDRNHLLYYKTRFLNNAAFYIQDRGATDSSLVIYNAALNVARSIGDEIQEITVLINLGSVYQLKGDINKALSLFESSLNLQKKINSLDYRATTLNNLANIQLHLGNVPAGIGFHLESVKLAEQMGDTMQLLASLQNTGSAYYLLGDYDKAMEFFNKSSKLSEEKKDYKFLSLSYNNMGKFCLDRGDIPGAMDYFFKAYKAAGKIKFSLMMAASYNSIAHCFQLQGDLKKSLQYYEECLKLRESMDDKSGMASALSNIGFNYYRQNKMQDAISKMNEALLLSKQTQSRETEAQILNNLGVVYMDTGNPDSASVYFYQSMAISKEIGYQNGHSFATNNLSKISLQKGKNQQALNFSAKALEIAETSGNVEQISNAAGQQYRVLLAMGRHQEALLKYELHIKMRDSLVNQENRKESIRKQFQFDYDRKESLAKAEQEKKDALARRELENQKLVRNGFMGGFIVVLLFSGIFLTQRNKIRKGKQRSDELLLNILPHETAEELKAKGNAEAKSYDEVTVMFTDFKDFTQTSEKLTAAKLVEEIHFCYSEFDRIVQKFNLEKIKTIGDSYMCAAGLPVPHRSNAVDAASAALEIMEFMEQEQRSRKKSGNIFFEIRIGMHTGPVVAGIVGIKKFAYDIWGDTVNIASRMESSGEAGKINVSNATFEKINNHFNCTYRGKIDARNKGHIDMYFVEGKKI